MIEKVRDQAEVPNQHAEGPMNVAIRNDAVLTFGTMRRGDNIRYRSPIVIGPTIDRAQRDRRPLHLANEGARLPGLSHATALRVKCVHLTRPALGAPRAQPRHTACRLTRYVIYINAD